MIQPECNCEANKKGTPTSGYSNNLNQSKENGVFQFEVKTDKSVSIFDGGIEFQVSQAWVENTWSRENYILGKAPLVKNDSSYQLLMTINIKNKSNQKNSNFYYYIHDTPLDTFMHYYYKSYYNHKLDTIKVPLQDEIRNQLMSRKVKSLDSLIFVKRTMYS